MESISIEDLKERFIDIYRTNIKREGADKMLEYLLSPQSDFFTCPASTRYHGSFEGGLLWHSLHVYECLKAYMERERVRDVYGLTASDETIALVALLHDICKVNFYTVSMRNAKNEQTGVWEKVPYYTVDDKLPYGHGEKSVYIISGFMRLTREEAFAIRFHMGFSQPGDVNIVGNAFEMFPLAYALHAADMEATVFLERGTSKK